VQGVSVNFRAEESHAYEVVDQRTKVLLDDVDECGYEMFLNSGESRPTIPKSNIPMRPMSITRMLLGADGMEEAVFQELPQIEVCAYLS